MENFFMLPNSIFETANKAKLSMAERWILLVLMYYANNEKGFCFASNKTIADTAGVSIKTVKRSLQNLSEKGFISIQPFLEDYSHYGEVTVNDVTYSKVYRKIEVPHLEPTLVGGKKNTQAQIDTQGQNVPRGRGQNVPRGRGQNVPRGRGQNVPTNKNKRNKIKANNIKNKVSSDQSKSDKPITKVDDRLDKEAMKIAKMKNVDDPVAYHFGILKNWWKKGIKTWKDYKKMEENKANSKHSDSKARKQIHEKLPDWARAQNQGHKKSKKEKTENGKKAVNTDISRLMSRIEKKTKNSDEKKSND